MKILSIDFDYFQNVTPDIILRHFPDGIDLPTELSIMVWSSRYSNANPYGKEELESVDIDHELFDTMVDILYKQSSNIPVSVWQSHVHAYDFIAKQMEKDRTQELCVVNVDLHHDMMNDSGHLDCGNWIKYVKEDFPQMKLRWIGRDVSCECYGLDSKDFPIELSLESLYDLDFDAVFICRSDPWLPPHLDNYFHEFINSCAWHFTSVMAEECIMQPRDLSAIIEQENHFFGQLHELDELNGRNENANNNTATKR